MAIGLPDEPQGKEPIFNVPAGIIALLGLLIAIHFGRSFLTPETDNWFVGLMAFIPVRYSDPAALELPGGATALYTSWITHMLMHASVLHLAFNSVWLLAFGGAVGKRAGSLRCIVFAAVCGIAGALVFLWVNWGEFAPMVGASGAVMGLMGAAMRFLYPALNDAGGSLRDLHASLRAVPLMTFGEAITDIRVIMTAVMLIIINMTAAAGLGPGASDGAIAWEAHAGGFLAGFLLYGLFEPAPHNDVRPTEPSESVEVDNENSN